MRGIPTMVLEQNAVPGLTNRLLAPFVEPRGGDLRRVAEVFRRKGFVSGNPVRREFLEVDDDPSHDAALNASRVRVLVFGGSQGAHAINVAMVEAAPRLAAAADNRSISSAKRERATSTWFERRSSGTACKAAWNGSSMRWTER